MLSWGCNICFASKNKNKKRDMPDTPHCSPGLTKAQWIQYVLQWPSNHLMSPPSSSSSVVVSRPVLSSRAIQLKASKNCNYGTVLCFFKVHIHKFPRKIWLLMFLLSALFSVGCSTWKKKNNFRSKNISALVSALVITEHWILSIDFICVTSCI